MSLFKNETGSSRNVYHYDINVLFSHSPNGRKVVLGVHSLSEPEETKETFDILELHNHPDYNALNYDNDIALIKVKNVLCRDSKMWHLCCKVMEHRPTDQQKVT